MFKVRRRILECWIHRLHGLDKRCICCLSQDRLSFLSENCWIKLIYCIAHRANIGKSLFEEALIENNQFSDKQIRISYSFGQGFKGYRCKSYSHTYDCKCDLRLMLLKSTTAFTIMPHKLATKNKYYPVCPVYVIYWWTKNKEADFKLGKWCQDLLWRLFKELK